MHPHMPRFVLVLLSLLSLFTSTSAWSTGSGTCYARTDAVTRQTGRHPLTPNLGFYLDLPLQYKAGAPMTVVVANSGKNASTITHFNGFLLYATDPDGVRVGRWAEFPNLATTDLVNAVEAEAMASGKFACDRAEGGTITHSTGGAKKIGLTLTFTPPADATRPLTFYGLVEFSSTLYYTQVLTPIRVCPPNDQSCTSFDPSTLPNGPLPAVPSPNTNALPFGLSDIDSTACAGFAPVPNAVVPPGFCASFYTASGVVNRPRGIYVTDRGDLLVLETGNPTGVSVLRDLNGDGVISKDEYTRIFTQSGLNHGLYVHAGYMYVTSPNTVWRLPFNSSRPTAVLTAASATVVVKNIPGGGHSTRTPLVSHDGRWLYVSVGSAGNLDNDDSRSRVIRYDLTRPIPTGGWQWNDYAQSAGAVQAFARGLRNEVGLTLDLQGDVWGCMNADDNLNRPDLGGYTIHNDNPAERVDHLREQNMGGWYGYPYCWAADILAGHRNGDLFGWGGDGKDWYKQEYTDDWCRDNTIPASYALQAHTAPLGLLFYDGRGRYAFPPEYFNQLFLALHGSWNSDTPRGYKVTRIGTDPRGEALASTSRDFLAYRGPGAISNAWPHKPADVRVGPQGELFVSSPDSSQILVIRYNNPERSPVTIPRAMGAGYNYTTVGGPTRAVADFTFDRRPANASDAVFKWLEGDRPHTGLAYFDGVGMFVNATRADNGAGVAAPNVTGGSSSYEVWLQPASLPDPDRVVVVLELSEPTVPASPQDGWIRLLLGNDGLFSFEHRSGDLQRTDTVTQYANGVRVGEWVHVVVTVNQTMRGAEVNLYVTTARSRYQRGESFPSPIPVMARRSGLIGRPFHVSPQVGHFHGYIDALRLYSFPISDAQVALSYALESVERISPALQINLHMQPMESSEATWTHMGPSSRYQPTTSTYFPGWASFNGNQSIDLLNPGNSMGGTWRDQLRSDAFSVELWVRARTPQSGAYSILSVPPFIDISHPSTLDADELVFYRQESSLNIRSAIGSGWTQLVLVGVSNATRLFINGTGRPEWLHQAAPTSGAPTSALLGAGFVGEVAILRVFDTALTPTQVSALFAAQQAEQGRPELSLIDHLAQGGAAVEVGEVGEEEEQAPLSFAGIIGVVVALSALITAAVVAYAWYSHKKVGVEARAASVQFGTRLLGQ